MKMVSLGLVVGLLAAAGAASAAMPSALQHPWKIIRSDGSSYVVTFTQDGAYTTNNGIHGTWKLEGGKLCVMRSTGEANCVDAKTDAKPGDTWKAQDAAGHPVTVEVQS
jgi:hypothetical protein